MRNIEVCRKCPEYYKADTYEEFCDTLVMETDEAGMHSVSLKNSSNNKSVRGSLGGGISCITAGTFGMIQIMDKKNYIESDIPDDCPYILESIVLDEKNKK